MNYKIYFKTDNALFFLISVYLLYMIWFQYAFKPINGLLSVLGVLILCFSFLKVRKSIAYYKNILPVALFILITAISNLFSGSVSYSFSFLWQILKYSIPMYGIYVYIDTDHKKLVEIIKSISVSCFLITITSYFKTLYHVTYVEKNAITNGTLNANVFSSYMMLGIIGASYLFIITKNKFKYIYLGIIAVELMAQINAASRRGFIVCLFLMVALIHTIIVIQDEKKPVAKIFTVLLLVIGIVAVISELSVLQSNFVIFQRLFGIQTGGDLRREYYHAQAIQIFKQYPFLGNGLGAVAKRVLMYSHSLYFELLACTGIIGSAVLLGYFVSISIRFLKISRKKEVFDRVERSEARMFFWYNISVLICGFAVTLIYDAYFYIIIGLFAASLKVKNNRLNNTIAN